jgi:hypothetical protein
MKLAAAGALMLFARSIMGAGCPNGQVGVGTVQTCLIVKYVLIHPNRQGAWTRLRADLYL